MRKTLRVARTGRLRHSVVQSFPFCGQKRVLHSAIEQFNDVHNFLLGVVELNPRAKLQKTAGIGGDDCLGTGRLRMLHFFGQ